MPEPTTPAPPSWVVGRRLKPGDPVRMTAAALQNGFKPATGVVTRIFALSEEYVEVRVDGQKRLTMWAARFWEKIDA